MPDIVTIYGPPGTGKTTHLLDLLDKTLADQISPGKIGYLAFTRKAANEARDRVLKRFSITSEQIPYFRTCHSLAFKCLNLRQDDVMGRRDYLKIAKLLGIYISLHGLEDGTTAGYSIGDRLLFTDNLARAMSKPLKEVWEQYPDEDLSWDELERLSLTITEYKRINNKLDFTDMINMFVQNNCMLDLHTLFVDEAQDLSRVQWQMIESIMKRVEKVFIAGDDDQAIFRWAGADVDRFINLEGERQILNHSWRVPEKIHTLADKLISQVHVRVKKTWKPKDGDLGMVEFNNHIDEIDMSKGTWLLLARNNYLLEEYTYACLQEGFLFDGAEGQINPETAVAIAAWNELVLGLKVPVTKLRFMYDRMAVRDDVAYGFKQKLAMIPEDVMLTLDELHKDFGLMRDKRYHWSDALSKMNHVEREYFLNAVRIGEPINGEARIKISTIHGVKGGEADNVVIKTDMAVRTFREYQENPDDEHRVWYVAVTRAKQTLHIISPETEYYYGEIFA